jgi:hypothetical protein
MAVRAHTGPPLPLRTVDPSLSLSLLPSVGTSLLFLSFSQTSDTKDLTERMN